VKNQNPQEMKEASLVKYYFTKYFFLAFGLLQMSIGGLIYLRQGDYLKGQFAAAVFFTLGLVFVSLFLTVSSRIKRVAIGKKKITIIHPHKSQRYEWDEIKFLRLMPVFNLYCMKIRGKKEKIYFLPSEECDMIYGLFPTADQLVFKKDK
jgi:hypothetical protein